MSAKSIVLSTLNASRVGLALLLTALLVSPDLALAQEPASPCTTGTWTTMSSSTVNLAPLGSPSYYGVETFAASVATVNGTTYVYALGGMNCNTGQQPPNKTYDCTAANNPTFQTQVGRAVLGSDGSVGSFTWQNLWPSPNGLGPVGLGRDLCGVIYTSPTTGKNYIYTVGGYALFNGTTSPVLTNQIWYAQLYPTTGQNNGELLTWHQAKFTNGNAFVLPSALDLEGLAVLNGYLYIIGGSTNADPTVASGITDNVWSVQLNSNSGNLIAANTATGFTAQPPILPPPNGVTYTGGIYKTCPVAYPTSSSSGMIFVAGGQTNNGTSNHLTASVEFAVQGADGSLTDGNGNSQWGQESGLSNLPGTLSSQAVVYNTGIILMGGQDAVGGTQDTDNVYLGTINSNTNIGWSSLDSLSRVITGNIERNAGAANSTFIYSLGGEVSHNGNSSDSTAIYCLKL